MDGTCMYSCPTFFLFWKCLDDMSYWTNLYRTVADNELHFFTISNLNYTVFVSLAHMYRRCWAKFLYYAHVNGERRFFKPEKGCTVDMFWAYSCSLYWCMPWHFRWKMTHVSCHLATTISTFHVLRMYYKLFFGLHKWFVLGVVLLLILMGVFNVKVWNDSSG